MKRKRSISQKKIRIAYFGKGSMGKDVEEGLSKKKDPAARKKGGRSICTQG